MENEQLSKEERFMNGTLAIEAGTASHKEISQYLFDNFSKNFESVKPNKFYYIYYNKLKSGQIQRVPNSGQYIGKMKAKEVMDFYEFSETTPKSSKGTTHDTVPFNENDKNLLEKIVIINDPDCPFQITEVMHVLRSYPDPGYVNILCKVNVSGRKKVEVTDIWITTEGNLVGYSTSIRMQSVPPEVANQEEVITADGTEVHVHNFNINTGHIIASIGDDPTPYLWDRWGRPVDNGYPAIMNPIDDGSNDYPVNPDRDIDRNLLMINRLKNLYYDYCELTHPDHRFSFEKWLDEGIRN